MSRNSSFTKSGPGRRSAKGPGTRNIKQRVRRCGGLTVVNGEVSVIPTHIRPRLSGTKGLR